MKHNKMEKAALKEKSCELELPFSSLLAGYVLEELMYLITESPFADNLWLKNGAIFGVDQYRKKNILKLEFAYLTNEKAIAKGGLIPGQKLSLKMAYVMLMYFLDENKVPEIKWKGRASIENSKVELEINGEFEEMTVPIQIRIFELPEHELRPVRKKIRLLDGREIQYCQYPYEMLLTEQLLLILLHMELIPEMQPYDRIYSILSKETIDGRHMRELLTQAVGNKEMEVDRERLEEILSYKNYTYMRKRWEKYLRQGKRKEPSWDEVMDTISQFLPGIWNAICRDEVFFGDWMPDLGRFLD